MRWRAAPEALHVVPLDELAAVYHRPSGRTHLLAEPAPQILAALAESADLDVLRARLAARFDLGDDVAALAIRVEELAAVGLIAPA